MSQPQPPAERSASTPHTDELCRLALAVRPHAHAPYSRFQVGAALRAVDGRIFTGVNVENASFGATICAERTAIVCAVAAGAREFSELVVALPDSPPAAPCGLCRQMLAEFARDLPITLVNDRGERIATSLAELLPRAFHGDELIRK